MNATATELSTSCAAAKVGPVRVTAEAAQSYLERRVKPQQQWFNSRSADAKRWHYWLAGVQLAATAAIPAINVFTHSVAASTLLAFVAAIASGFSHLWKFQDHWTRYRSIGDALEALHIRYELRLPPFNGDDAHDLFVAEADKLLGDERTQWVNAVRRDVKIQGVKPPIAAPADAGPPES
jgi:hypothetical protein